MDKRLVRVSKAADDKFDDISSEIVDKIGELNSLIETSLGERLDS